LGINSCTLELFKNAPRGHFDEEMAIAALAKKRAAQIHSDDAVEIGGVIS